MTPTEDAHLIDQLISTFAAVPAADGTEAAGLDIARQRLQRALSDPEEPMRQSPRRRWAWRLPAGAVPVLITCGVALLVAAVALIAVGQDRRSRPQATLRGAAAGPGANALMAKLAVLRRPQTAADRLPANLHFNILGEPSPPTIIPSLSRLVATPPGAKIYLVVTEPYRGPGALWSPSLGDQLDIVAITASGVTTEGFGYPAADITDPMNIYRVGIRLPNEGGANLARRFADAYDVAIVPDGVTRVRWTFGTATGGTGPVLAVRVRDNVAVTKITRTAFGSLRTTWYAADGGVVPMSSTARTRLLTAENASRRRTALRAAGRSHVRASPAILRAFAVFGIDSRSGTREKGGYIISHPTLSQLPLVLLSGSEPQLDFREARKVVGPEGLTLFVVPGARTLCLFIINATRPTDHSGSGADSACAGSVSSALTDGAGESSGRSHTNGAMVYAVVPRTTHEYRLRTGRHSFRIIHPIDGVVIAHTPFRFG